MVAIELADNDRRMILKNGQILRIVNLDHDVDTAVYQCNASNPFGYVFGNAFVNVRGNATKSLCFFSKVNLKTIQHM